MITKVMCYGVRCDRCGKAYEDYDDHLVWSDEGWAEEQALNDEWIDVDFKHFCPDCYKVDEKTDENIILPMYTKEVRFVKAILREVCKTYCNISLTDSHWLIEFSKNKLDSKTLTYIQDVLGDMLADINETTTKLIYSIKR